MDKQIEKNSQETLQKNTYTQVCQKKIPKVSVVIPVYNTPQGYLRACLESVVGQTLKELEIILVEDCSTDGSLEICQEYAKKDQRIVLIQHEKNQGISISRNHGADAVTGEYLYFIDCDDWIEAETLETVYLLAKEHDLDSIIFSGEATYESPEVEARMKKGTAYLKHTGVEFSVSSGQALYSKLVQSGRYQWLVWLQLMKTSHYREHQISFHPLTAKSGEDCYVSYCNFLYAKKMACLDQCFYHYRIREGSGSVEKRNYDLVQGFLAVHLLTLLAFQEAKVPEEHQKGYQVGHDFLIDYTVKLYRKHTGQDPSQFSAMLHHLWSAMAGDTPLKSHGTWADFQKHRGEHLYFFGSGLDGVNAIKLFQEENWRLPLGICDNNEKNHGKTVENIPILSLSQALSQHPKARFLITSNRFYSEIRTQLLAHIPESQILDLSY